MKNISTFKLDNLTGLPLCPYSLEAGLDVEEPHGPHLLLSAKQLLNSSSFKNCKQYFLKFCDIQSSKFIYSNFKTVVCPKENCRETIVLEIDSASSCTITEFSTSLTCPYCTHKFCHSCLKPCHLPFNCQNSTASNQISHKLANSIIEFTSNFKFSNHHLLDVSNGEENLEMVEILADYCEQILSGESLKELRFTFSENLGKFFSEHNEKSTEKSFLNQQKSQNLLLILRSHFNTKEHLPILKKLPKINIPEISTHYEKHKDAISIAKIKEFCVACPSCLVPIEKHTGCNNMRCVNCNRVFNYKVGGAGVKELSLEEYQRLNTKKSHRNRLHLHEEDKVQRIRVNSQTGLLNIKENYVKKSLGTKLQGGPG